ncbi:uncharacterized protein LOC106137317 [Amyelois transitella]|uniref:uncharacterized protein LOC106137317 n=1 Tax=Amyelois transitella TaxID=680683 RepID=UPI00067BE772|nr:uncharacterized protein LOC106137317 [Amyelois transitella]
MGSLSFWTTALVLYQSIFCIIISYSTLTCQLKPERNELHEITLVKLLYFYDPEACSRIFFYNFTEVRDFKKVYSNIVWPLKNHIASSFRGKLKVWLSLHILWSVFAFGNLVMVEQPCRFYAAVLPFSVTGVVILVVDVIFMSVFVKDSMHTRTENDLLMYISNVKAVNVTSLEPEFSKVESTEDISWISLLMAYSSCRAIVQYVINFWMIKDNFFEGLASYR